MLLSLATLCTCLVCRDENCLFWSQVLFVPSSLLSSSPRSLISTFSSSFSSLLTLLCTALRWCCLSCFGPRSKRAFWIWFSDGYLDQHPLHWWHPGTSLSARNADIPWGYFRFWRYYIVCTRCAVCCVKWALCLLTLKYHTGYGHYILNDFYRYNPGTTNSQFHVHFFNLFVPLFVVTHVWTQAEPANSNSSSDGCDSSSDGGKLPCRRGFALSAWRNNMYLFGGYHHGESEQALCVK